MYKNYATDNYSPAKIMIKVYYRFGCSIDAKENGCKKKSGKPARENAWRIFYA